MITKIIPYITMVKKKSQLLRVANIQFYQLMSMSHFTYSFDSFFFFLKKKLQCIQIFSISLSLSLKLPFITLYLSLFQRGISIKAIFWRGKANRSKPRKVCLFLFSICLLLQLRLCSLLLFINCTHIGTYCDFLSNNQTYLLQQPYVIMDHEEEEEVKREREQIVVRVIGYIFFILWLVCFFGCFQSFNLSLWFCLISSLFFNLFVHCCWIGIFFISLLLFFSLFYLLLVVHKKIYCDDRVHRDDTFIYVGDPSIALC